MGVISSLTERGLVNEGYAWGVERLKTNWCRDDREFGGGINDGARGSRTYVFFFNKE